MAASEEAPKPATMREYQLAHLLGGPDSTRLEFNTEYYQQEFAISIPGPLVEYLRDRPAFLFGQAVQLSASEAMDFFEVPNEVRQSDTEAARYVSAGRSAIKAYLAADQEQDFSVDTLPFTGDMLVPETQLRETGRLALQRFKVYQATVETGEVPEL
jgi:hypothetical protein